MRVFTLLVLALIGAAPAYAGVGTDGPETWYVRPAGACQHSGDGLAYDCASSPGQPGAFVDFPSIGWAPTTGIDDGDTLYVCGAHTTGKSLIVAGATGSDGSPITLNFDCPGDSGLIRHVTAHPEALAPENWTHDGGDRWSLVLSGYAYPLPRRLWINGVEQIASNSLANVGARINSPTAPIATWWFDQATNRLTVQSASNPAVGAINIESLAARTVGHYAPMRIPTNETDWIRIVNPRLEGGHYAAIYVLGSDHITIEGTGEGLCRIGRHGVRGLFISDTNGNGTGEPSEDVLVRRCTVDPEAPLSYAGYAWEWNSGQGDGVDVAFGAQWVRLLSNTIRDWPHANLSIRATSGTGTVRDVVVLDNALSCSAHVSYCRGFTIDGNGPDRATRILLFGNTFDGFRIRSQFNGNGNTLIGNVFRNQRPDLVYGNRTESVEMQAYTGTSYGNFVAHNTLSNAYAPCISIRGNQLTLAGHMIVGNRLLDCGGAYIAGSDDAALVIPPGVGTHTVVGNTIYHHARPSWVLYREAGKVAVPAFDAACSGDRCGANSEAPPTGAVWGAP